MPRYRIALPDGRTAVIQADEPSAALAAANAIPRSKSSAEKSTYSGELIKQRKSLAEQRDAYKKVPGLDAASALTVAPFSPIAGEAVGLLAGVGNEAVNLKRRVMGEPTVSSRPIYEANRDAVDESFKSLRADHPNLALTGDIAGALTGGKAAMEGAGLLGGLKPVAAATKAVQATKPVQAMAKTAKAAKAAATAKVGEKAVRVATKTAKAAAAGGAAGGAYGFAEGRNLDERLENAGEAAGVGTLTGGLLEGVVAPVASKVGGAVSDAVRPVVDRLRGKASRSADDIAKAAQNALLMAKSKGVTPQSLDELAAADEGLDTTFAEALGSEGQATQAALARRPGATGDAMRSQMRARNLSQPGGITEDFQRMLGVSPEAAAGDTAALVEQGKRNAGPLFDEALAGEHGVTSPELERLLATPAGQKLIKGVITDARNLGEESSGLTMGRVEVPEPAQGVHPMAAPPVGEFSATPPPVPRGPAEAPSQGESLATFLRNRGMGIGDDTGELAGRGLRINLSGTGKLDDHALAAGEAGYFPELGGERPTINHLLDALQAESAGAKRFAREADPAAQQRFDARAAAERDQAQYSPEAPVTREEHMGLEQPGFEAPAGGGSGVGRPEFEPALQEAYTPKALDTLRRAANDQVAYDFGKLAPGRKNAVKAKFARKLRDALAGPEGALPGLDKALETSSGYLRLKDTFERFSGKLTRGSDREFKNDWLKLKGETERDAARAALANDIRELWGQGQLRGGKFATRGVEEKLTTAFGKDKAAAFVKRMERRAELAASGNRMAPFSGSPTMSLAEASSAVDTAIEPEMLKRVGGKLAAGRPLAALGDAAGSLLMKAITYPKSVGSSVEYRDELGRILGLDAAGAADFLRAMENMPEPARRDFARQLGLVAGSQAGAGVAGNREPVPAQ